LTDAVASHRFCNFRTLIPHCSVLTIGGIGLVEVSKFFNHHRDFRAVRSGWACGVDPRLIGKYL
jgi:hypothetical protein